jgi:outer membrane lipoprotein-sorting protein
MTITMMLITAAMFAQPSARPVESPTNAMPESSTKAPSGATHESAAAFEKKLQELDAKMAKVVDLRASFEQRKKTALLKKPIVSSGTLSCKGESVLWRTLKPRESQLLVTPDKVTVYYPADKLAEVYPVGARFRDAAGGPLPRLPKLREKFEMREMTNDEKKALGVESSADRLCVALTPKGDELKKYVAMVRVVIDTSVPCADRVVVSDPEGDETEIRFSGVTINVGMKDSELELALPEGTKVSTPGAETTRTAKPSESSGPDGTRRPSTGKN